MSWQKHFAPAGSYSAYTKLNAVSPHFILHCITVSTEISYPPEQHFLSPGLKTSFQESPAVSAGCELSATEMLSPISQWPCNMVGHTFPHQKVGSNIHGAPSAAGCAGRVTGLIAPGTPGGAFAKLHRRFCMVFIECTYCSVHIIHHSLALPMKGTMLLADFQRRHIELPLEYL